VQVRPGFLDITQNDPPKGSKMKTFNNTLLMRALGMPFYGGAMAEGAA
jgi:hypothetical protein